MKSNIAASKTQHHMAHFSVCPALLLPKGTQKAVLLNTPTRWLTRDFWFTQILTRTKSRVNLGVGVLFLSFLSESFFCQLRNQNVFRLKPSLSSQWNLVQGIVRGFFCIRCEQLRKLRGPSG